MKVELLLCLLVYQWYNQQSSHVYVKYVYFFPQFYPLNISLALIKVSTEKGCKSIHI